MKKTIFWFRRDLRLHDNHGLFRALKDNEHVLPIFIFDQNILEELPEDDARVTFIHVQLKALKKQLNKKGGDLIVRFGTPISVWESLLKQYDIDAVYTNHDYEPYALERDQAIQKLLEISKIKWHKFKDHVLFENQEVKTAAGGIYTVFTPYKRKWLAQFKEVYVESFKKSQSFYPSEKHLGKLYKTKPSEMPMLEEIGFTTSEIPFPDKEVGQSVIKKYGQNRNFPALKNGTSRLGIHYRFGTISIREKALKAWKLSEIYLSELIWRDFYIQIMANFPHVVNDAFRPKYDKIPWREAEEEFQLWCRGLTGYPIVDAGMRELNNTGYMHNRVRMIVASFLTKHLLIDWRKGEAYFAMKLLDYELASNNGGWQWASGSGTDAAPYFRIFNPTTQMEKFDKDKIYIKRWIPEYGTDKYPLPIVDHKFARERCLETYKLALNDQ